MSDTERVLSALSAQPGQWIAGLYGKTHVLVHSRVAELRRRGYLIQCQRFGPGDYRYRLLVSP